VLIIVLLPSGQVSVAHWFALDLDAIGSDARMLVLSRDKKVSTLSLISIVVAADLIRDVHA
jgi:hypothetical protein